MAERSVTSDRPEVVCVGETMALMSPVPPDNLLTANTLTLSFAGAESTVALYLASLGWRTRWISRLGEDPLGRRLATLLHDAGVDVSGMEFDSAHPTGVFFKHPTPTGTKVYYYRANSAASRMSPRTLTTESLEGARVVHISGITPALSESAAALIERVFTLRDELGFEISFDVNYRPPLWSVDDAAPVLLALARHADIVFVGLDEAQLLWKCTTEDDVRRLIGPPAELVIKDGGRGATVYHGDQQHFEPAVPVEVVEPVGAGDSFAAGYLHRRLGGSDYADRLRTGHQLAAAVLRTTEDFVHPREAGLDVPAGRQANASLEGAAS